MTSEEGIPTAIGETKGEYSQNFHCSRFYLMKLQVLLLGGGIAGPAGVVRVRLQLLVHVLEQHLVGGVAHVQASLVHQGHDAVVGLVNQLADDLGTT